MKTALLICSVIWCVLSCFLIYAFGTAILFFTIPFYWYQLLAIGLLWGMALQSVFVLGILTG